MEDVCAVNVLKPSEDLVGEVAHVIIAEVLRLEELVKVSLHQRLDNVDSLELVNGRWPHNVQYRYDLGEGGGGGGREGSRWL